MPEADSGFGEASLTREGGYTLDHLKKAKFQAHPVFLDLKNTPHTLRKLPKSTSCLCDRLNLTGPPVLPSGPTDAEVMIIGRDPGELDCEHSIPFHPESSGGRTLDEHYLPALGLTREEVYITNVLFCRGASNKPPTHAEKSACYNLHTSEFKALKKLKYIFPLGTDAFIMITNIYSSISPYIGQYLETDIYSSKSVKIIPIHHPGYSSRSEEILSDMLTILRKMSGLE